MYRRLFEEGDCFIAVSDYNYRNLINFGLNEKKIIYHPYGIDLDTFSYRGRSESSQPIKVLTVARLVKEKGLEYGIKAVNKK